MVNFMNHKLQIFHWGDIFIFLFLLAGVSYSIPLLMKSEPQTVDIYRDNEIVATYPLYQKQEILIPGAHDTISISIQNNAVSITHADCPHQLCVKSGSIRLPGQQIVCAPNHILISISCNGSSEEMPDGIAR